MKDANRVDKGLSTGLALFSVGLGLVELFAPRALSRFIGLKPQPMVIRAMGMREIASGVTMLARPESAAGPSSRVAGDVMDLAVMGSSPRLMFGGRKRTSIAILAVVVVAAVDLLAQRRLSAR